jgi:hypothetical protein
MAATSGDSLELVLARSAPAQGSGVIVTATKPGGSATPDGGGAHALLFCSDIVAKTTVCETYIQNTHSAT